MARSAFAYLQCLFYCSPALLVAHILSLLVANINSNAIYIDLLSICSTIMVAHKRSLSSNPGASNQTSYYWEPVAPAVGLH